MFCSPVVRIVCFSVHLCPLSSHSVTPSCKREWKYSSFWPACVCWSTLTMEEKKNGLGDNGQSTPPISAICGWFSSSVWHLTKWDSVRYCTAQTSGFPSDVRDTPAGWLLCPTSSKVTDGSAYATLVYSRHRQSQLKCLFRKKKQQRCTESPGFTHHNSQLVLEWAQLVPLCSLKSAVFSTDSSL